MTKQRGGAAGRARERQVADVLRSDGWTVVKGTSFGVCDLVALRREHRGTKAWLLEVKSTAGGPYERFQPADREALRADAEACGARAILAWWPPRKQLRLIPETEWPK